MPVSNQDADQLLSDESDSPLALAIQASLEDFEVHFGPVTGDDGDNQDSTIPWNPHDLNSIQHSTSQERHTPRSGNISWNSVRGKMTEYPDYDQTILRRNGKLLEECG